MDAGHVSENTYLKKSNKRSDQVATQKNGFCLLFSAKNRIYKQNTLVNIPNYSRSSYKQSHFQQAWPRFQFCLLYTSDAADE